MMVVRLRRFGTVAALTIAAAVPFALADGSSPTMVVFSVSGSYSPYYATWNGSSWGAYGGTSMPSVGANPYWVLLRNCPTRNEYACVTMDANMDVNALFWQGSSWTSATQLCADTDETNDRNCDVAYEQQSGDALIVYYDETEDNVGYYTYNGASLSGEFDLSLPSGVDEIDYITLFPKSGSDQIIMLAVAEYDEYDARLLAAVWDGASWSGWTTLCSDLETDDEECYSLAYESVSGDALVVYAQDDSSQPRYRTWNGASWSSEASMPSVGDAPKWVRLASNPNSDQILFGSLDGDTDVNVNVWNGSSWGSNLEVETSCYSAARRQFDLAFEPGTGRALLVYHEYGTTHAHYRTWNGSSWSSENDGTDVSDYPRVIQLRSGVETGEIFIAVSDFDDDLELIRWNGTSMSSSQKLYSTLGGEDDGEQFMIAVPGGQPPLFTDVSVAMGFNVQSTNDYNRGSGLHWGDLDNDGDLDCIATGSSTARRYMNNNAGEGFTVSTFGTGDVRRQGALLDIDNDGDLDFWAACVNDYDTEACYQNNGAGSFTNIGNLGLSTPSNNAGVAAADVNQDGWCDMVMFGGVTNGNYIGHSNGGSPVGLVQTNASSYGLNGYGDTGNGEFCASGDVNNDGYLDFFYDWNHGRLFVSDGDGTYTSNARGISVVTGTGTSDKFGPVFADYDNDGDLDLFVPREDAGYTGYLWRNDVNWAADPVSGSFTNVTTSAGLTDTSGQRSACWGDYDNDGYLDLYIVTHSGAGNVMYQNQGPPAWNFVAVSVGASAPGNGHDAVFVDYDNDGDLDLAVTQQSASNTLLRNNTDDENYLKVRVVGLGAGKTNKAAVGVRVELWNAGGTTRLARRDIGTARGFAGGEPLWAHFGGVTPSATYTVKVYFHSRPADEPYAVTVVPQSASTTIGGRTIPQMVTIEEPQGVKVVQWREKVNAPTAQ